LREILSISSM